jgi:hypothetical protein
MDVQGYEAQVFEGMRETLKAYTEAAVISEVFPGGLVMAGSSVDSYLAAIESLGFRAWLVACDKFLPSQSVKFEQWHSQQYGNLFAWRRIDPPNQ